VAGLLAVAGLLLGAGSAQAETLPTLTLTIGPSSIAVGGAEQSGAVNVVSTATGTKEAAPVLVLLKPGVSTAEVEALLASNTATKDPNTVSKIGSLVFDTEAPVGKSEAQTVLAPGQYVALNAEGEKSSKWPRSYFTVTTAAAPASLPAAQAVEHTIDFGFRGPAVLHDGELVRFENEGYVVHMDLAFPTKSRKAARKLVTALLKGSKQAEKLIAGPPASFAGPLSTGGFQQETITAKPGWYVQACFMETQDGRAHTLIGMERIIKIVK